MSDIRSKDVHRAKNRPPLTRAATEVNESSLKSYTQCRHSSLYKKNPKSKPDSQPSSVLRHYQRARGDNTSHNSSFSNVASSNLSRHRSCPHLLDEMLLNSEDRHDNSDEDVKENQFLFEATPASSGDKLNYLPKTTASKDYTPFDAQHRNVDNAAMKDYDGVSAARKKEASDNYNRWIMNQSTREKTPGFGEPPFSAKTTASCSFSCSTSSEDMFRFDRISTSVSDNFSDIEEPDSDLILEERVSDTEDMSDSPEQQSRDQEGDDKCNRWIQGLQLTQSDRLKSRSHLRLPPV